MRKLFGGVVLVLALGAACGKKADSSGSGSGSANKAVEVEKPIECPAGNVADNGKCVAVVTPEKIDAVAKQQSRVEDLAKLLDKVDTLATPIELVNGLRKLDEWKKLSESIDVLKTIDTVLGELDGAVKQLRMFKGALGDAAGRLGNLKGELDRLMTQTGVAKQLADVRTQVSSQLRSALEPLAEQLVTTLRGAIGPLDKQLERVQNGLKMYCGALGVANAGDNAKKLCSDAEKAFETGMTYFADLKTRPQQLFGDVRGELEKQLNQLIDTQATKLLDAAQTKVNEALKLPAK